MSWVNLPEFRCPGCGANADVSYDVPYDSIQCRRCDMKIAIELAKDMQHGHVPIWITEDQRVLRICDMETSHIQKCIGMIFNRTATGWRGKFMKPLLEELKRRKQQEALDETITDAARRQLSGDNEPRG